MKFISPTWLAAALLFAMGCAAPEPMSPTSTNSAPKATETPVAVTETPVASAPASPDAVAQAPTIDLTVVPGERVGAIDASTSRTELAELYGEENLTDADVPVGEGFVEAGTTLDMGEGRSLNIIWSDETRTQPLEARDLGSAWQLPEGIGVGTTLEELEETLGSFELTGFGWDYGGTVFFEGTPLAEYDGLVWVRLAPPDARLANSPEIFEAVMGDRMIPSDDPNLDTLDLTVVDMGVYLSSPSQ
ncbi:hypothetical protein [Vacuolonema iberomarrocanum]|uniref:hypothetical protein n=1 Tax=Vacuolonema iberomarrocanum TaxID=3454632 RepID=UPI0019E4E267|nr:hypothetical protein [filamentous cyanobacterium LEGE 07170]